MQSISVVPYLIQRYAATSSSFTLIRRAKLTRLYVHHLLVDSCCIHTGLGLVKQVQFFYTNKYIIIYIKTQLTGLYKIKFQRNETICLSD